MLSALTAEALEEAGKRIESERTYARYATYRYRVVEYVVEKLGWTPWSGSEHHPGQMEILLQYEHVLRQLFERRDYERGLVSRRDLQFYKPGQVIQNRIRIEAGHTVGKTKLLAGIVSHFFDCCAPSILYTFAPTYEQINDLLWKEIRRDRQNNDLPGKVLRVPEMYVSKDHFAKGKATSNSKGTGTERVQGQHGAHLLFGLDESEGIDDYVWNGINSMTSGGIAVVLMAANPRTRTSQFHKQGSRADTQSFRISCINHPNVVSGQEVVPEAVRREYVIGMVEDNCQRVATHNDDLFTFELPWEPGIVYLPNGEFMFRVMGVAPKTTSDRTFFTVGGWEAAINRAFYLEDRLPAFDSRKANIAQIGIDIARYGQDFGTMYVLHRARAWQYASIQGMDGNEYAERLVELLQYLASLGVAYVSVRVDAGGGYAASVDPVKKRLDVVGLFRKVKWHEVHFGSRRVKDRTKYYNVITELYASSAETTKGIAIMEHGDRLEDDLLEREWEWVNWKGKEIRRLVAKDNFKDEKGWSPDDGDGYVLATAPEFLFKGRSAPEKRGKVSVSKRIYGLEPTSAAEAEASMRRRHLNVRRARY